MFILVFVAIGIIGAALQLVISKKKRSAAEIFAVILLWALIVNGITGIFAFFGHVFNGPEVAKSIGWPANNPFQFEVGIANLGLGVLGFMCIWKRDDFWLATIVMASVFSLGAAYGHIDQIVRFQNFAPNNAGVILYYGIFNPIVLFGLYFVTKALSKRDKQSFEEVIKQAA